MLWVDCQRWISTSVSACVSSVFIRCLLGLYNDCAHCHIRQGRSLIRMRRIINWLKESIAGGCLFYNNAFDGAVVRIVDLHDINAGIDYIYRAFAASNLYSGDGVYMNLRIIISLGSHNTLIDCNSIFFLVNG